MIEQFQGKEGKRRLEDALLCQKLVQGDRPLAKIFARVGCLIETEVGGVLIKQDDETTSLFMILSGEVDIVVNGTSVAKRSIGDQIGEMALIEPGARRSATVKALKPTVTLEVNEASFYRIAAKHCELWRRVALPS